MQIYKKNIYIKEKILYKKFIYILVQLVEYIYKIVYI